MAPTYFAPPPKISNSQNAEFPIPKQTRAISYRWPRLKGFQDVEGRRWESSALPAPESSCYSLEFACERHDRAALVHRLRCAGRIRRVRKSHRFMKLDSMPDGRFSIVGKIYKPCGTYQFLKMPPSASAAGL